MEVKITGGIGIGITRKLRRRMMSNSAWALLEELIKHRERRMYIHNEIQKVVLPFLEKYDLELIDLIGELNHAAWGLSVLNKDGIEKLKAELEVSNVKVRGRPLLGDPSSPPG